MNLNPSTMRLGIASILVGLVGAYGVRVMMEEEEAPAEVQEEKKVLIPVATANLPAERIIRRGDMGFLPMTEADANEKGWNLREVMRNENQIIGRRLMRPLRAGNPFLTSEVYLEDYETPIAVTPGMRTADVRIAEDRGGGRARRGDTVDLFFTTNPDMAKGEDIDVPIKTIPVADAIQVLHVEYPSLDSRHWAMGYNAKAPIFTLEVEPNIAGAIEALKKYGDFSVLVRASDEPAGRSKADGQFDLATLLGIEEPTPPQQPPVVGVEYWHGGRRSMKYFPVDAPAAAPNTDQFAQQGAPGYPTAGYPSAPRRNPVAEVLPDAPEPAPAARPAQPRRVEPQPEPRVPFRPDSNNTTTNNVPSVEPPAPPTPSVEPIAPPPSAGPTDDPFMDDKDPAFDAGDVLP